MTLFPAGVVGPKRERGLAVRALGAVLEGRGEEQVSKALAADEADALSVEDRAPRHPHIICPTCGRTGTPDQIRRHFRAKPDHEAAPRPEHVPNENVVANPEADLAKSASGIEILEALYDAVQEARR